MVRKSRLNQIYTLTARQSRCADNTTPSLFNPTGRCRLPISGWHPARLGSARIRSACRVYPCRQLRPGAFRLRRRKGLSMRGPNSDMLAPTTLQAMLSRRNELEVAIVPDQGHAALLCEPKAIRRIAAFVASCDCPPGCDGERLHRVLADRHPGASQTAAGRKRNSAATEEPRSKTWEKDASTSR